MADEPVVAPRLTRKNTLSIPLTSEGYIDWDSVSEATKEKYEEIIANDPVALESIAASLGGDDGSGDLSDGGSSLEGLTEANCGAFLDSVCSIQAITFAWLLPKIKLHPFLVDQNHKPIPFVVQPDIAVRCFQVTPEQHKELDPRLYRVAQKYQSNLPDWAKRNMDVYMLIGMFAKFTFENATRAMTMQAQKDFQRATAPKVGAVKPKAPDSDVPPPIAPGPPPSNGHAVEGESLDSAAAMSSDMPIPLNTSPEPEAPRV
jgi:hypothetical protein